MKKNRIIKIIALALLIVMLSSALFGCNMQMSEDVFVVGNKLEGSKRLVYSLTNEEQGIDGDLIFKYVVNENETKMQTYSDLSTWEYKAQVIFNTNTLLPSSSYKANVFYSEKEEDWSVSTDFIGEKAVIKAVQEDEVAEKLSDYTARIRHKIESNFYEFDQLLDKEGLTIMRVNKVQEEIRTELKLMKH